MRFLKLVSCVCLFSFVAVACNDEKGTDGPKPSSNGIVNGESQSSAFTLTFYSTFNGLNFSERTYGRFGAFFAEKGSFDQDAVDAWANGGTVQNREFMKESTQLLAGDRMKLFLEGLEPETEYELCAFFEAESGRRMVGKTQTVSTKAFTADLSNPGTDDVKFFSAMLNGALSGIDSVDTKYCSMGFILSEDADPTIEHGTVVADYKSSVSNRAFSIKAKNLDPSKEYHYRPFVYLKPKNRYFYGEVKGFSTRDFEETVVDMGGDLEWSRYIFGADSDSEEGYYYRYGEVEPVKSGVPYLMREPGMPFDGTAETNISGTEYDPVRHKVGGDWRMPTTAEMKDLFDNCTYEPVYHQDVYKTKLTARSIRTNGKIVLPQTGYYYSYGVNSSKNMFNSPYGYFLLRAADLHKSFEKYSRLTIIDNDALIAYEQAHMNETIYVADLEALGIVKREEVEEEVLCSTIFYPNNYLDELEYYDNGSLTLNEGKWGVRTDVETSGSYAFCTLAVRNKKK